MPFFNWLKENNKKGLIGEFGVPGSDTRWLTMLDRALTYMKENNVSGTYWAGGPWWGSTYKISIEPSGTVDSYVDKPQMSILQKYGKVESDISTEIIDNKLIKQDEITINCANNYLQIKSESNLKRVEIYNLIGLSIYRADNQGSEINVPVDNFSTGNYIIRVTTEDNHIISRKIFTHSNSN